MEWLLEQLAPLQIKGKKIRVQNSAGSWLTTINLHQQITETVIKYVVVVLMNTMTSLWYMCIASAPIHIHAVSVK